MFNPFFWMFKQEKIKRHFIYLFSIYFIFIALAVFLVVLSKIFFTESVLQFFIWALALVLFVCPFLCFQGYFWNLTENIINRDVDVSSSTIFNGKIKEIYKIELPEIRTGKFIWRGIASIVASILLFYPFIVLFTITFFTTGNYETFYNFDSASTLMLYLFLFAFLGLFIPALLWNYAKKDSIFAVWNLPKAIHIIGSYFGKYIWNTVLFLIFVFANHCITLFLIQMLGLNSFELIINFEPVTIIKSLIFLIIQYLLGIYWIFVNAYLLGTIAPPSEA